MIVPVVVEGQSLRWHGRIPEIADNSIEFVQLEFRFPEDWDGMVIVAQFTQAKTYNCLLVNNRCFLPMELVAGPCEVSVFGYLNEEVTRGTTIPLKLNISRSGFVSSAETPIPPTPDLYAQLIEYFSSIAGSGGGGSGGGTINPEDIAAAVEDYLSKNPPEVPDLSDEVERAEKAASNAEAAADRAEEAAKVTTDLDTTLSQSGKAADAKAVGDALMKMLSNDDLTDAINDALAQAKESGEFDGKDGYTPVKGKDYFDGKDGLDGKDGEDYILTEADKTEIAEMAAKRVEIPESSGGGASAYYVTVTGSNEEYTADKTIAEIMEAHEGGQLVYCVFMGQVDGYETEKVILPLVTFLEGFPLFSGNTDKTLWTIVCVDPTIYVSAKDIASIEDIPSSLPSPGKLTFTGAVTGTYNGVQDVTIEIPNSGGNVDLGVTGATVGQTVKISAVDENGVPTAWESVDFPSGGGKELVGDITLAEAVASVELVLEKPCFDLAIFIVWEKNPFIDDAGNPKSDTRLSLRINDLSQNWCTGILEGSGNMGASVDVKMSTSGYVSCRGSNASSWGNGYSTGTTEFLFKRAGEIINKISFLSANSSYLINSGVRFIVMGA